jgi:hypothetical protein
MDWMAAVLHFLFDFEFFVDYASGIAPTDMRLTSWRTMEVGGCQWRVSTLTALVSDMGGKLRKAA